MKELISYLWNRMELDYDYIICWGGASGLSIASALSVDQYFSKKKILIIDPEHPKKIDDRTWCFWEKEKSKRVPIAFFFFPKTPSSII